MTSKIRKLYNVLVVGGVIAAAACHKPQPTLSPKQDVAAQAQPKKVAPAKKETAAKPEATGIAGWS